MAMRRSSRSGTPHTIERNSDSEIHYTNSEDENNFAKDEKSFFEDDDEEDDDDEDDENLVGDDEDDENFIGDEEDDESLVEDEEDTIYSSDTCEDECQKVFDDRQSLLKHIRVCPVCTFKYKRIRRDPD
ncbi:hypothetical protein FLONG3_5406, partial [Fusarium longipes]